MGIINERFMLQNATGRRLYHDYAAPLPIIDYHCHLSAERIAKDVRFADMSDLFLGEDHYKWRQMRSNGIDEQEITGAAGGYLKWCAFAKTVPLLIGNPLYHWTALELKRYFDIDEPLTEESAEAVWEKGNALLQTQEFSARQLILRSNVEVICTTDDPLDDLRYHRQLQDEGFAVKVLPTFRPDKAVEIGSEDFLPYLKRAGVTDYGELLAFLRTRIAYFDGNGCRLADHGLGTVPFAKGDAEAVFCKKMQGIPLSEKEIDCYRTAVLQECAKEYAARSWAMQLHIGAIRNNNRAMFDLLGADTGFDSIGDSDVAQKLARLLNEFSQSGLPKTILYNLNPKDNYVLASMIGNFQQGPVVGKMQFGSGWWFNDNRDGMEAQLKALANLGVLGNFVGMLTDSRSFVSYPRHEYFRRILCNLIGQWVEQGEYPADENALKTIVEGICYTNAKRYFCF